VTAGGWVLSALGDGAVRCRIVGMGLKGGDGDAHPVTQRESVEKVAQLRLTLGAVEAKGPALTGCRLPEPHDVTVVNQLRRGGRFGGLAVVDLRLEGSRGNIDVELD
jgi:hypothetical protein